MTNIVYYVIEPNDGIPGRLLRQAAKSWASLRQHDPDFTIHLFYGGSPPEDVLTAASRFHVSVHETPPMIEMLARYTDTASSFREFQAFGKHLVLDRLPPADGVLYVDCDTFWYASPARLFDSYWQYDFAACCEVGTRRFLSRPEEQFIDEDALTAIVAAEGLASIPPINSGVIMTGAGLRQQLISRTAMLVDYAVRFLGFNHRRLALPCATAWVVDEIALLLTLGSLPDLSWGFLSPRHVPISNRWKYEPAEDRILSHYFGGNEDDFFQDHTLSLPA